MTESSTSATPQETILDYVEACRHGKVEKLRTLFSPSASMSGFYGGEFYIGSPEIFFDTVRNSPSPASTGAEYTSEIKAAEIFGDIANITLKEKGYLGSNFTNLFHLAYVDESWIIVSKLYIDQ